MIELKIHVEKAVRPLHAYPRQKLRIREELLAHLQGIYDEEFERTQDEASAVKAAIKRFGPADELTEKLRASLPWYSLGLSWLLRPASHDFSRPESVLEATWWGWRLGIMGMVLIGAPWYLFRVLSGDLLAGEAAGAWVMLTLYGFALLWPWVGLVRATQRVIPEAASARRAGLFSIALWCGIMSQPILYWSLPWFGSTIAEAWRGNDAKLLLMAIVGAVIPIFTILFVRSRSCTHLLESDTSVVNRIKQWEQLDLDA